jgi:hypothetical protein
VVSVDVVPLLLETFPSSLTFTDTIFVAHHHISFSFFLNSTHYAPLFQSGDFLLGHADSETYRQQLHPEGQQPPFFDWDAIRKAWPFYHFM